MVNRTVDSRAQGIVILLEPDGNCQPATVKKRKTEKKTFLPILLSYKKMLLYLLLGVLIGAGIQMAFPILTQWIVDKGIEGGDISFILMVLIGQMALITGNMFNDFFRKVLVLKLGSRFSISLLTDLVTKMLGDVIQRIGDHTRIKDFITETGLSLVFSIFNVIILGTIVLIYDWRVFLIFIGGTILYLTWVLMFMKRRAILDKKVFAQSASNQSNVIQLVMGMQEIKLCGCEEKKRWEWERIQAQIYQLISDGLTLSIKIDIHPNKIDNKTSRPTDFQQKCRLSVGLLFPK